MGTSDLDRMTKITSHSRLKVFSRPEAVDESTGTQHLPSVATTSRYTANILEVTKYPTAYLHHAGYSLATSLSEIWEEVGERCGSHLFLLL